jgi:deoxyribonuclease-2
MKLSALDEQGKPVDWWFIYKVPELRSGEVTRSQAGEIDTDKTTGYEYVYFDPNMDPNNTKLPSKKVEANKGNVGKWQSDFVINEGKGALNLTLDSVFKKSKKAPSTLGWILYNDEIPDEIRTGSDNGNLGHTKGVIAFDTASKTAFWLLHSWPKFADPNAAKDPTPKYGQTYLCLSLDLASASKIAAQMVDHQEPQVYVHNPANLPKTDALFRLTQPIKPSPTGDSSVIDLKTAAGMPFKVIAKNKKWNNDFWNNLVGPTLKEDIDVETWIRGKVAPTADRDGIHKTFDIKFINLGPLGLRYAWPETSDHAKWGITKHANWVCVGDINRMISQRKRGGGTIAFQNETLWKALSKTSMVLAPPGHTREHAHEVLQKTHLHRAEAPEKGTRGRLKRKIL